MTYAIAIRARNESLGVEDFNPDIAIGLSHVIVLFSEAQEGCNQRKLMETLSR